MEVLHGGSFKTLTRLLDDVTSGALMYITALELVTKDVGWSPAEAADLIWHGLNDST